jgi:hypothetical protein
VLSIICYGLKNEHRFRTQLSASIQRSKENKEKRR